MKVLAINGSPHKQGSTAGALGEFCRELAVQGIESEIFWIGDKPIAGCTGCNACRKLGRCVVDDKVNEALEKFRGADGIVLASPVHYSGIAGAMKCFLDRFFYTGSKEFYLKVGTVVASLRRSGGVATFDQLSHYLTICNMVVTSSSYWNVVHGNNAAEGAQDSEGMHTMRVAARDMAYVLKKLGAADGIEKPELEPKVAMNFIR